MGQATLLRTLTVKSTMGFGIHKELKVGEVINLNKKQYLRWCYYNLSNITFTEDILIQLGITEEYRIEKPGKNVEHGVLLDELIFSMYSDKTQDAIKKSREKRGSAKRKKDKLFDKIRFSKGNLQRLNHGHK